MGYAIRFRFRLLATGSHPHRFEAAFFAISLRCSMERAAERALPPALPLRVRPDLGCGDSEISPVAIFATMMAAPITSAGLRSPRGPVGMRPPFRYYIATQPSVGATGLRLA